MRLSISLLVAIASVGHGFNVGAQDSSCVIVRDGISNRPIATARVRVAEDSALAHDSWTNAAGRVCWRLGSSFRSPSRIEAGALGYQDVSRELRVGENAEVGLHRAVGVRGDSAATDKVEWRQGQMVIAIALALRDVRRCVSVVNESCATVYTADITTPADMSLADSAASMAARARLRSAGSRFLRGRRAATSPQPGSSAIAPRSNRGHARDFVDNPDSLTDTPSWSAIPSQTGRASFGATEMRCVGTDCSRHRQLSVASIIDMEGQFAPSMAIATDGRSRVLDAFDLSASSRTVAVAPHASVASPARLTEVAATRMAIVRGVAPTIRDAL